VRVHQTRARRVPERLPRRTTAGDDNLSDDSKMSSPKKTAIGDADVDSPIDQEMRDDSSLSSQAKTASASAGEGDTASSAVAECVSRRHERSPTPEVDYESLNDQPEHGVNDEANATSQSPALSFSPSLVATQSPYSPPFSLASVKEEGEIEEKHLDRGDRDDTVMITNATEESEERAAYAMVEYYPWMPSRELIEYLDGYSDKRWTYRLFDCRPIERDPWLARSFPKLPDRRRILIDVLFQRRLYSRHLLPRDRDGVALTQAWNHFLANPFVPDTFPIVRNSYCYGSVFCKT
jgi:hypothetical protein